MYRQTTVQVSCVEAVVLLIPTLFFIELSNVGGSSYTALGAQLTPPPHLIFDFCFLFYTYLK